MDFKIITPLRTALDLDVTGLKLPATQGEMKCCPAMPTSSPPLPMES